MMLHEQDNVRRHIFQNNRLYTPCTKYVFDNSLIFNTEGKIGELWHLSDRHCGCVENTSLISCEYTMLP